VGHSDLLLRVFVLLRRLVNQQTFLNRLLYLLSFKLTRIFLLLSILWFFIRRATTSRVFWWLAIVASRVLLLGLFFRLDYQLLIVLVCVVNHFNYFAFEVLLRLQQNLRFSLFALWHGSAHVQLSFVHGGKVTLCSELFREVIHPIERDQIICLFAVLGAALIGLTQAKALLYDVLWWLPDLDSKESARNLNLELWAWD
jgi:hypothetical protein